MKIYKTTERQRENARRWQQENPVRYRELQAAYRNGETARNAWAQPEGWTLTDVSRFKRFGLRPEDVRAKIAEQGGGCAVCATPEPRGKKAWHVDHDHATGRVRGILCLTCNIALGMLHDDPERARAAAAYLDNSRQLQELF